MLLKFSLIILYPLNQQFIHLQFTFYLLLFIFEKIVMLRYVGTRYLLYSTVRKVFFSCMCLPIPEQPCELKHHFVGRKTE